MYKSSYKFVGLVWGCSESIFGLDYACKFGVKKGEAGFLMTYYIYIGPIFTIPTIQYYLYCVISKLIIDVLAHSCICIIKQVRKNQWHWQDPLQQPSLF